MVVSDFNLHVSNEENVDSAIFNDTIEAMGLYQHVSFPIHKAGNTLDLVISEIQGTISLTQQYQDPSLATTAQSSPLLVLRNTNQKGLTER